MPFMRFNPGLEIDRFSKEAERVWKDFFSEGNRPRIEYGEFKPRVDIIEDEKNIIFEAEVPGVNKDDVKVSVNDENILTIKGEKKFAGKDEIKSCCRNERAYGNFTRAFQLPENVDAEKISAKYDAGVLTLTIPKLDPVKPKEQTIEIK